MFSFFYFLSDITQHNNTTKVPSVHGISMDEGTKILEKQGFNVEVIDSVYVDTMPPLAIVKQSPDEGSVVKGSRTIYLTVNRAQPPTINMPNLIGLSYTAAKMYMKSLGLKLGDTTYKPDIAENTVLQQMQKGGDIQPGEKVLVGTKIDLVLGSGLGDKEFDVPDLFGLTYTEAQMVLAAHNINVGAIIADPDVRDTATAFVYRQNPPKYMDIPTEEGKVHNRIRSGQVMDMWLSVKQSTIAIDSTTIKEEDR